MYLRLMLKKFIVLILVCLTNYLKILSKYKNYSKSMLLVAQCPCADDRQMFRARNKIIFSPHLDFLGDKMNVLYSTINFRVSKYFSGMLMRLSNSELYRKM